MSASFESLLGMIISWEEKPANSNQARNVIFILLIWELLMSLLKTTCCGGV